MDYLQRGVTGIETGDNVVWINPCLPEQGTLIIEITMGGNGMKLKSNLDARESIEHIEVSVRTPGGTWPTEGFILVPLEQKIALQLDHARKSLKLENKKQWVATADGVQLNTTGSYRENGLSGRVLIEYAPASAK